MALHWHDEHSFCFSSVLFHNSTHEHERKTGACLCFTNITKWAGLDYSSSGLNHLSLRCETPDRSSLDSYTQTHTQGKNVEITLTLTNTQVADRIVCTLRNLRWTFRKMKRRNLMWVFFVKLNVFLALERSMIVETHKDCRNTHRKWGSNVFLMTVKFLLITRRWLNPNPHKHTHTHTHTDEKKPAVLLCSRGSWSSLWLFKYFLPLMTLFVSFASSLPVSAL